MCLIVFDWQPGSRRPLYLAANRDEFHARPTLALHEWDGPVRIWAGRDLSAGGTWLGANADGRVAALTNVRSATSAKGERSRGELVSRFLQGSCTASAYADQVWAERTAYAPFNLLLFDTRQALYLGSQMSKVQHIEPGLHGLSNARLDTDWPKLQRALDGLRSALLTTRSDQRLLRMLSDRRLAADADLPSTGVPLEWERLLSSVFICNEDYGTRCSSVLRLEDGELHFTEQTWGTDGSAGAKHAFQVPLLQAQPERA